MTTRFDPKTQTFVDDDPREFPITAAEDHDAGRGLAIGCTIGVAFWTILILVLVVPWTRGPLASFGVVLLIIGVVWASSRIVDRWRRAHPDNPIVDQLRRWGL